ncbi:hypothetical protein AB0H57_23930 [Micromonospora sp. NPDC050686]|uniref:hypothetical protein n=1 Tax=Micromonospora sp. NPDC050686 TaxID=3154631 RepID=UPI0034052CC3
MVLPRPLGEVEPGLGAAHETGFARVLVGRSWADEIWVTATIPPKTASVPATASSRRLLRALPDDRRARVDLRIELLSFSIR